MRTAIDTNVFSAVWGREAAAEKISLWLDDAATQGDLVISPAVYVELRANPYVAATFVDRFLDTMRITVDWIVEQEIWLLSAERFEIYAHRRRHPGTMEPKRFPADFLIAAHALLHADRLVTLDQRRYRRDFPELIVAEL
jgi:hypothetical protein